MPDITMCHGGVCPIQKRCYRHRAIPTPFRQSWFVTEPWDPTARTCDHFVKTEPGDLLRGTPKTFPKKTDEKK